MIYSYETNQRNLLKTNAEPPDWIHTSTLQKVKWNHRGDRLATAAVDGMIGLWTADGQLTGSLKVGSPISALAWSPDDRWLAAGDTAGSVWVWDFEKDQGRVLTRNLSAVNSLDWDSESKLLALGTAGGMLRVLDITSGRVISTKLFRPGQKLLSLDENGLLIDGDREDLERNFLFRTTAVDGTVEYVKPAEFQQRPADEKP